MRKIGINVKLEQADPNAFIGMMMRGEISITSSSYGNNMLSVESAMSVFSAADPSYGARMAQNAEFEELMPQILAGSDPANHRAQVIRAMEIMYEMANIIPLYDLTYQYAHSKEIKYGNPISAANSLFYLNEFEPA